MFYQLVQHVREGFILQKDRKAINNMYRRFLVYFLGELECVGHSFAFIAHFVFLTDVWIRTQRAAGHPSPYQFSPHLAKLSHPSPWTWPPISLNLAPISLNLATYLPKLSHPSP
jgi:hypothetical protein